VIWCQQLRCARGERTGHPLPRRPASLAQAMPQLSLAAGTKGLPPRAQVLFERAKAAEAAGELREAMRLYDVGVQACARGNGSGRPGGGKQGPPAAAVDAYLRKALTLRSQLGAGGPKAKDREKTPPRFRRQKGARQRRTPLPNEESSEESVPPGSDEVEASGGGSGGKHRHELRQLLSLKTAELREQASLCDDLRAQLAEALHRRSPHTSPSSQSHGYAPTPVAGGGDGNADDRDGLVSTLAQRMEEELAAAVEVEKQALAAVGSEGLGRLRAAPNADGDFIELRCRGRVLWRGPQARTPSEAEASAASVELSAGNDVGADASDGAAGAPAAMGTGVGGWRRVWLEVKGNHVCIRGTDNEAAGAQVLAAASLRGAVSRVDDSPVGPDDSNGVGDGGGDALRRPLSEMARLHLTVFPTGCAEAKEAAETGEEALPKVEWVLALNPDHGEAAAWVAVIEAGARYGRGVALHRRLRSTQELLRAVADGAAALRSGRPAEAVEGYRRALALCSDLEVGAGTQLRVRTGLASANAALSHWNTELAFRVGLETKAAATERAEQTAARLASKEKQLAEAQAEIAALKAQHSHIQRMSGQSGGGCCSRPPRR
jgi:tetratricopeptide (TPR) repeat protein